MKIQEILSLCRRPGRYIGREKNAFQKPWDQAEVRAACIFPDLYEIGMSHLGLQILYDIINRASWALADRAYCPDTDLKEYLRRFQFPLFGLETRRALSEFDCLLITLPYELCYSNIFTILDLAGIPLWQKDRMDRSWPLVVGGGSCCLNPEPVADLFDAIVIGDGEEVVVEILKTVKDSRETGNSRQGLLERLFSIKGIYVPSFYRPVHSPGACFLGMDMKRAAKERVRRRIIPRLGGSSSPGRPLVPNVQVVHDRLGVEIARGCTRGCRYCQASTIYRPVREREPEDILSIIEKGLDATGWEEISLLSLSTGDYSSIESLIKRLMDNYSSRNISVSLPSLRVGTLTPEIMEQIKKVRKTGFTLAPEAGSDRLRQVINKGISEKDLLETARQIGARGWNSVKLYFMIGLPTETDEDVQEIVNLARRVMREVAGAGGGRKAVRVTVSVGTFVPKPHTPFQWESQLSVNEALRRISIIKEGLRGRKFHVKWHDPVQSFLEGAFSRGGRELSSLLHRAWQNGAMLDAWSDSFRPDLYFQAARELDIDLGRYLDGLSEESSLPWDHIDSGVKKAFLRLERKRASMLEYMSDCRKNECQHCGVCDFERIKPVLSESAACERDSSRGRGERNEVSKAFFCRLSFSKLFDVRFLGHLDMVRMFLRAVRRAGLRLAFSRGFHPMPRVSFSQPISLGTESLREEAVLVLEERLEPGEIKARLNEELPMDIMVETCSIMDKRSPIKASNRDSFLILLRGFTLSRGKEGVRSFLRSAKCPVEIEKKGRKIAVDLTERVPGLCSMPLEKIEDVRQGQWAERVLSQVSSRDNTFLRLDISQEKPPYLKPALVTGRVFNLEADEPALLRILKLC